MGEAEAYTWLSARVLPGQWCDLAQLGAKWPTVPLLLRTNVECVTMRAKFALHSMDRAGEEFLVDADDVAAAVSFTAAVGGTAALAFAQRVCEPLLAVLATRPPLLVIAERRELA